MSDRPTDKDAVGLNPEGQPWDDARCLTVWRCRAWGCGNVVTLLRTACNSFGPAKACANCGTEPSSVPRPWEMLRHENVNPGAYPFPSVASLVEMFQEADDDG